MGLPFPNVPNLPGVPQIPRSSAVTVNEVTALASDQIGSLLWQSQQSPTVWGIYDAAGQVLLVTADSVVDFQARNEWQVASFPVQQGQFADYNKVKVPSEYMVRLTKGGSLNSGGSASLLQSPLAALAVSRSQALSQAEADYYDLSQSALLQGFAATNTGESLSARTAFLQQIDQLAASLALVTIVTPEATYSNVNVTRYEYMRRGAQGAYFLDVDVYFIQILQVSVTYQNSSANPNGTSNASDPTALPAINLGTIQPLSLDPQTQAAISAAY